MMRRKLVAAPLAVAILVHFAAGCTGKDDEPDNAELLRAKAQSLISELTNDTAPGTAAYAKAPETLGVEFGVTAGVTDRDGDEQLTTDHPVAIASVTKTFVAAAILRLWEDGEIELDQSITSHLNRAQVRILADGGYDVNAITIRHLLVQTSGIVDFYETRAYAQMERKLITGELKHQFTLEEQLQMAMEGGPSFAPGESFEYSDSNYSLLGAILENVTGESMAAATRRLVGFDRLGLADTYWEVFEPEPDGALPRAHQQRYSLYTDPDASNVSGWDILDTAPFDLYGGGGLVSTTKYLATFFYALFNEQVFRNPETIKVMMSVGQLPREQGADYIYGHGLQIREIGDITVYAHGGAWGTWVGYAPELDMSVSVLGLKYEFGDQYRAAGGELMSEAARLRTSDADGD